MIARSAGFRRLVASTMPGNQPMQRVFRTVGLATRQWFEDGVVHVQLDLTADHLMEDDSDLRDWRSAVESLRPILQPAHVVVIGASRDGTGPGHASSTTFALVHRPRQRRAPLRRRRRRRQVGRRQRPRRGARPGDHRRPGRAAVGVVAECGRPGWRRRSSSRPASPNTTPPAPAPGPGPRHGQVARHADRRAELPRCRLHPVRAQRHVHRAGVPARWDRHRRPVRRGRHRHRRRSRAARRRHLGVRVDGQQGRRQQQRPAPGVGRRRRHHRRHAVPGVVRRPAPLRPRRPGRVPTHADRRPQGRAQRTRPAGGPIAHRRAGRRRRRRRRPVRPHRCHPGADARGARRRRAAARPPASTGRIAGRVHRQCRWPVDPRRRRRRRPSPRRPGALAAPACDDHRRRPGRRGDGQPRRPDLGDDVGQLAAVTGRRALRRGRRLHPRRRRHRRVEPST